MDDFGQDDKRIGQMIRENLGVVDVRGKGVDPSRWTSEERCARGVFEYVFPDGRSGWARRHFNRDDYGHPSDTQGGIVEYPTAVVDATVYMEPETCVYGFAQVFNGVALRDCAQVGENAIIHGSNRVVHENCKNEKNIVVIRGQAKVLGDTKIQHLDHAFLNFPDQREVIQRIRKHVLPVQFGMVIEGILKGWNEIAGIELQIGPEITMTDSLFLGRNIALAGKKEFVKKNITDARDQISTLPDYDPLTLYEEVLNVISSKTPLNPETPEEMFVATMIPIVQRYIRREEKRPGTKSFRKKGFVALDGGIVLKRGPHRERNSSVLRLVEKTPKETPSR